MWEGGSLGKERTYVSRTPSIMYFTDRGLLYRAVGSCKEADWPRTVNFMPSKVGLPPPPLPDPLLSFTTSQRVSEVVQFLSVAEIGRKPES